jgi:hypothetical protein
MSGKGGTTTTAQQTTAPPEWARPALERAGQEAMRLYTEGKGFNTYTGPTRVGMSNPKLSGMNALLAATGYQGAPVTNQTVTDMVPDVNSIMAQVLANKPKPQPQAGPAGPSGGGAIGQRLW